MQCDPADVTAHHFDDHATTVRFSGGAQAVDRLGRDFYSGVETERVVGGGQVVVDGLRHANDLEAGLRETVCSGEGAFATNCDDGVDAMRVERALDVLRSAVLALEGVLFAFPSRY